MKLYPDSTMQQIFNDGYYHFFPGRSPNDYNPFVFSNFKAKSARHDKWIEGWKYAKEEYEKMKEKQKINAFDFKEDMIKKSLYTKWQKVEMITRKIIIKRRKGINLNMLGMLLEDLNEQHEIMKEMNEQ